MPTRPRDSRSMHRLAHVCAGFLTLAALAGMSACAGRAAPVFQHNLPGPALPWTHTHFDTAAGKFSFAVIADLTGGERPGVFRQAVAQLALLRPELVMSVGDLIDGPAPDTAALRGEWESFDERARAMPAPLFRVGGNHDLTGDVLRDVWRARYGPTYYAFVYRDVLFVVMDTEDLSPERARELFAARTAAIRAAEEGRPGADTMAYYRMQERGTGDIGAEQAAYVRRAIAEHPDVRWTFLFLHKPVWRNPDDTDFESIEAALGARPYTVFSGHLHSYAREVRNGREYFTLGTTGGSQNPRDSMAFDHLTWVTVGVGVPSVALLRM